VKINSLSMVAEDHSDSKVGARALYQVIRQRLLKSPRETLLPLVYVVDSILKNAKGHYVTVVEEDAANWIPTVYERLQEPQKIKLQKVWKTWNGIFSPESLKAMGRCFDEKVSGKALSSSTAQVAGISRTVRTPPTTLCVCRRVTLPV
jgi:pre-mRNA cleavage complex 2 protein Pcf11